MRRRYRRGVSTVVVSTSYVDPVTDEETSIDVESEVTPGEPATGPRYDCAGEPGCGPEVEIVSAVGEDEKDYLEAIVSDRDWLARVEEKAIEEYGSDDGYAGPDTTAEARGER